MLVFGSFFFSIANEPAITPEKIVDVLFRQQTAELLFNTVFIGVGSGIVATALGSIYAWFLVRTNSPGTRALRLAVILPLSMPLLVKGFGWIAILSPTFGLFNRFFLETFGMGPVFNIYTVWGVIFAIGFGGLPLSFLIMEPAVRSIDFSLEESSRIAGRGMFQTFMRVTLPLLAPGMISSFILIMIFALGNFDYPFLFNATGNTETLATEIFFVLRGTPVPKYGTATIYSLIYLVIAFIAITFYWRATRQSHRFETVTGKASRQRVHDLGRWKYAGTGLLVSLWAISFLVPFIGIFMMSLAPSISTVFQQFTLANYADFLSISAIRGVLINTFAVSFAAAVLVSFFSVFISYTSLKSDIEFSAIGDYVATIPLGFPPIVYSLAIFWMVLIVPGLNQSYGTLAPLVLALVFVRLPHGVRIVSSNLIQIADELEEASRVSGRGWFGSFRRVTVPLLKGGVGNTFLYTFIDSMRELGAIVLLITAGNNVYTGILLQMYNQSATALPTISAGSVVLVMLIFVFVVIYMYRTESGVAPTA